VAAAKRKPKQRAYSSTVREEQAARTRARIVDAAAGLFESASYPRTTVRAIAERAAVAPDTVYTVFGTKARVLTAVIDARLAPAGDGNVLDRSEAQAIRDEPDQHKQIGLFARDLAVTLERVRHAWEILRTASPVEPELAEVHADMEARRYQDMRRAVSWIAANGPLRVEEDRAAELLWTLASPDVARMLLDGRAWPTDRYARWLEDTLITLLLRESPSPEVI